MKRLQRLRHERGNGMNINGICSMFVARRMDISRIQKRSVIDVRSLTFTVTPLSILPCSTPTKESHSQLKLNTWRHHLPEASSPYLGPLPRPLPLASGDSNSLQRHNLSPCARGAAASSAVPSPSSPQAWQPPWHLCYRQTDLSQWPAKTHAKVRRSNSRRGWVPGSSPRAIAASRSLFHISL